MLIAFVDSKSYNLFKVFSCCSWDLRSFIRSNMNRDAFNVREMQAVNRGDEAAILPDPSQAQTSVRTRLVENEGQENPLEQLISH